jgi:hypothetical protein
MYVRLSAQQIEGIFATGSAACARSVTVEAPSDALSTQAEEALASAVGGRRHRDGDTLVVDTSGPFMREEWLAQCTSYGPKTTVSLRAARALPAWTVLACWFVVPNVLGVALAASLFLFMDRVPGIAPGAAWIAGVIVTIVGLQAIAKATAASWTTAAHETLVGVERRLVESAANAGTYRARA